MEATLARPRTTRKIGPSLMVRDVAERLGCSEQWVKDLINRPVNHPDALPGYYNQNGVWQRKTEKGKLARPLFLYEEDVSRWIEAHPLKPEKGHIEYTEEEAGQILDAVHTGWYQDKHGNNYPLLSPNGTVKRAELMKYLNAKYGYGKWRTNTYAKIVQILEDAGISTPAPKITHRRVYKGAERPSIEKG